MKRKKRFAIVGLAGVIMGTVMLMTGCGSSSMGETVAKVDNMKIGMNEMMYYIYQTEQEGNSYEEFYQSYFGSSYWDMAYDEERTFRDAAKEDTLNAAVMYTIFEEKAEEAGYSLDEEEKAEIAKEAQTFYDSLSENQKETMGLTLEQITAIQEKIVLSNKYYEEVMAGVSVDEDVAASRVDLDEYRQYDVSYIYSPTIGYDENSNIIEYDEEEKKEAYEMLSSLLPKAKETEDFNELISEEETILEVGEIGFLKGDELFGAVFEKEALKLENGQTADKIIEEEDGYYIIRMDNNNSTESYDEAVAEAIENARYEAFQEVYNQMKEDYTIEINDSVWDDMVIGTIIYEPAKE